MKITKSKPKDLVSQITINVDYDDYKEKVDDILKDYRKKAVIPGFRKGKTPMSIINKKYKTSIVADEVNKILQDEMYKYITEKKLAVLGSPMPIEDLDIDWSKENFKFIYEVGLAPDFEIKITQKDKLDYYIIKVDKKLIDTYSDDIAKRNGEMVESNKSNEDDLLFCSIQQLDDNNEVLPSGIKHEASVSIKVIADEKIKKKFIGLKKDDCLIVNVIKTFSNTTDLAAMLNIKADEVSKLQLQNFKFTVKKVSTLQPAKLDNKLFDKVYGAGKVKNIKEFRENIKKEVENQFDLECDRMLKNDVVKYLIDKMSLQLPDSFLKNWLVKTSKQPITMDLLNKEYELYSKSLKWQLIENKILEDNNIKVTQEDLLERTKGIVHIQMKRYGQENVEEKQLISIAENVLKDEKEKKKIYDQIYDEQTLLVYKKCFKLKEKKISYDDFVKLASKK
tara:strand:+ start:55079 stop:56428 length:1350 start_codon:yes stop_codon:yes gene_type:complete